MSCHHPGEVGPAGSSVFDDRAPSVSGMVQIPGYKALGVPVLGGAKQTARARERTSSSRPRAPIKSREDSAIGQQFIPADTSSKRSDKDSMRSRSVIASIVASVLESGAPKRLVPSRFSNLIASSLSPSSRPSSRPSSVLSPDLSPVLPPESLETRTILSWHESPEKVGR